MHVLNTCVVLRRLGVLVLLAVQAFPVFAALPPATKRLHFKGGVPLIPVKLLERATSVTFYSPGPVHLSLSGRREALLKSPPHRIWTVRRRAGMPAQVVAWVQITEIPFHDKRRLHRALADWKEKGLSLAVRTLGEVYGIWGKVIDNRRYVLVKNQPPAPPQALVAQQKHLLVRHQIRTSLLEEATTKAVVTMELTDSTGAVVATDINTVRLASPTEGAPLHIKHADSSTAHRLANRAYRGALILTADRYGYLAVINEVGLEDFLQGLVPSEIFATAPMEALKAQSVTARGEVLAKIGLKHLADPYLLCAKQHCAVYKGASSEAKRTNKAIQATRGEAVFDADNRLVDSVYSAVCGGHTEDNDVVWGGAPNASLRGRPDILPGKRPPVSPRHLKAFLTTKAAHACRVSAHAQPTKYRWTKRFSAKQVDGRLAAYGIGPIMAMRVMQRGVSGRARLLQISGQKGATALHGELTIRRAFGMLKSAMFVIQAHRDGKGRPTQWVFTGGGWGHGVGMCQTGAIGRAEAGQTYKHILKHYYNNAHIATLY